MQKLKQTAVRLCLASACLGLFACGALLGIEEAKKRGDDVADAAGEGSAPPSPDAAAMVDGATDAMAAAATFCDSIDADFCEDFDKSDRLPLTLKAQVKIDGGSVALTALSPASSPRSVQILVPATSIEGDVYLIATLDVGGLGKPVAVATVDFDWRLDMAGSAAGAGISDIFILRSGGRFGGAFHRISVADGSADYALGDSFVTVPLTSPSSTWRHAKLSALFQMDGGVSFEGSDANVSARTRYDLPANTTVRLLLGGGVSSPPSPIPTHMMSFDNIVIRLDTGP